MAKTHAKHHAVAHHEPAKATPPKGVKIFGQSPMMMAIDLLIVGVIVGALITYATIGGTKVVTVSGGPSAQYPATTTDVSALNAKVKSYIEANLLGSPDMKLNISGTKSLGEFYNVSFDVMQGSAVVGQGMVMATMKDLVIPSMMLDMNKPIPSPQQQPAANVPKADKPKAELYIFSYCPAGTAALDSFAKAGALLKDVADVKVKFFSNMHGEHELQQNKIQECIQSVAAGKYWDYATQYASKVYTACSSTRSTECDKNESVKLMNSVGIDSAAVLACVEARGEQLYNADMADADALSLQYSPSVVINGVYLPDADRSAEGLKTAICGAFNTALSECQQTLSTTGDQATGGC